MTDRNEGDPASYFKPEPTGYAGVDDARLAALLHDLRTPLAAMKTASEVVALEPLSQRQASALHTLELAIDALLSMTQGFLDAPDGPAHLVEAGNAAEEIAATVDLFTANARARGLKLTATIDAQVESYALGDPLTLRRILSVLLDNALKYTGEGTISLTANVERGGARPMLMLELSDSGIGIPEDERPNLFRPRRRGTRAQDTASGSGLGLWSAARLATSAGGRLDLLDSSGQGSTFGLRLPLSAPSSLGDTEQDTTNLRPLARRRVLVVDDNDTNRQTMKAMLNAFGLDVVLATGGREALALFDAQPVDVILMDINMPGMDGIATLAELRKKTGENNHHLPIIGVTAGVKHDMQRLENAGFDSMLEKPVTPALLLSALDRLSKTR